MTTSNEISMTSRTTEEIENLEDWCRENGGVSHFPGMTYEDGIASAIDWLSGLSNENPSNE